MIRKDKSARSQLSGIDRPKATFWEIAITPDEAMWVAPDLFWDKVFRKLSSNTKR